MMSQVADDFGMTLGKFRILKEKDDEIEKTKWKLSDLKRRLRETLEKIEEFEVSRKHSGYYVGVKFEEWKPIASFIFHENDSMTDERFASADVLLPLLKQADYKEFEGF